MIYNVTRDESRTSVPGHGLRGMISVYPPGIKADGLHLR